MKKVWPWIFGVTFGIILIGHIISVRSTRESYWLIRGAPIPRAVVMQELSDQAEQWRLHHYYQR